MKWLLFECLAVLILGFYPADTFGAKPIIYSLQDEIVLQEGFALEIGCYSEDAHDQLQFSFPEHTFESPRSNHEISVDQNGWLRFVRRKVVFLDTGWYACAKESIQIDNHYKNLNHTQEDIAWIYVYVESSEPFADRYYTFAKTLIALADGSPVIIPCRPTSPNLNVKLRKGAAREEPQWKIRFDPKIGFIIEEVVNMSRYSVWYCVTNNGIEDQYQLYYVDGTGSKPTMVPNPQELLLKEGDELRIECYGETNVRFFALDLQYDEQQKNDTSRSKYEILRPEQNNSTFLRPKVVPEDTGWYGCAEAALEMYEIPGFHINYTRKEINWLYVYVETGYDRFIYENQFIELYWSTGKNAILPCRPVSPNSEVVLFRRIVETFTNVEMDENIRFHPKVGFVLRKYPWNYPETLSCGTNRSSYPLQFVINLVDGRRTKRKFNMWCRRPMLLTEEDLELDCGFGLTKKSIVLKWIVPSGVLGQEKMSIQRPRGTLYRDLVAQRTIFEVTNVTVNDSGEYVCEANNEGHVQQISEKILVFDRKVTDYINLIGDKRDTYKFIHRQNENVKLMVELESNSRKKVYWFRPSHQVIDRLPNLNSTTHIFHVIRGDRDLLEIKNITLDHAGVYRMRVETNRTMLLNYELIVHAPPTVSLKKEAESDYSAPNELFVARCNTIGSPMPNITWTFMKDPNFSSGNNSFVADLSNYDSAPTGETSAYSYLNMSTDIPGTLYCTACNYINCSTASRRILISDGVGRFGIIGPVDRVFIGDEVVLACAGLTDAFQNMSWDQTFHECYENAGRKMFNIEEYTTQLTIRRILHLTNVTKCHRRSYTCRGYTISNEVETVSYYLDLYDPQKPYLTKTNLARSKIVVDSESDDNKTNLLTCCANGNPQPTVTWFENNQPSKKSSNHSSPTHCELVVSLDLNTNKVVRYTCRAENRFGHIEDYVEFVIGDGGVPDVKLLIVTIALVFAFIIPVVWLVVRNHRRKVARRKFKKVILEQFDRGALQYIQPHMCIADQAEILPYDKKWEYPRNLLKFGKILGSGAFGLVRRAEAKSICPGRTVTTVAVKMVRTVHTLDHMTALSRELKVLVYLGQHENIVNLLGACTKNIDDGELFVIVEYCRVGNLQSYLYHRRANFIDQIKDSTEEIIGPHFSTNPVNSANAAVDHCEGNSDAGSSCSDKNSVGASESTANDRESIDDPTAPDLQCKWPGDYADVVLDPISTKDLLCWAWQVSRGMRYLGLRKVIHGDLAARNILLADHNVVKICDFGLSKALSYHESYRKQEQGPLPLKWSAPESIKHRVFSPESDVWSFGIVLWEFFTLAQSPYPGIHPRDLYQKLVAGYRMEQPKYATKSLYRMMMSCWDIDPAERPSFSQLERAIEELLDDSVRTRLLVYEAEVTGGYKFENTSATRTLFVGFYRHPEAYTGKYYVDLSATYTELNNRTLGTIERDYLTMDPSQLAVASFSKAQEKVEIFTVTVDESLNPVCPKAIPTSQDSTPTSSFD